MIRANKFHLISLCLGAALVMPQAGIAQNDGDREILYWVAPMDPNFRRDKPGKSPMGMDLVPVYASTDDAPGNIVSIEPRIVQNLGVRTAMAERSRLWRGISTVGYVDYDESKTSHIHLRTEGWIERLYVESEGERVSKGQRLFDLYSPALVNAQEEFIQALKIGNKGLEQASRDRLKALGIPEDQIRQLKKTQRARQTIAIYAPQDGVVSTLMVREGMFVKPADRVMSLAELSTVWLLTEVFERQADWVKVGQPAEVRLSYLPGRTWEGRVEYIYPSLDPMTRTLKARLRFDNPDEALKPNMYAHVKIFGGPKEDTIVIPLEALIRTGREERVILSLGAGRFESRTVTAGIESGDWVEILTGIDAGEAVVISGQFLIDSEASLKASMRRMGSPDSDRQVEQP
ncbi:MAG: efflux RND transporter periplasmic adaptor subunit [Gammaproteobacteria bacterium]|nr:efflux RND transporter periplasmic adaptor subunit [Gammaproteobacteria bacterium]